MNRAKNRTFTAPAGNRLKEQSHKQISPIPTSIALRRSSLLHSRLSIADHPDQLLALQRQVGNRTVGRMLAAQQNADIQPVSTQTAVRMIQRLSASVWWDRTPSPIGPLVREASTERGSGTSGGAHSTAHAVFEWVVINAVHHQNFATAVANLLAQFDDLKKLPGYQTKTDQSYWNTEIARVKGNPDHTNPAAVPPVEHTQVLQDLMVEYMKLRNTIPGTYITDKSGKKGV